MSVAIAISNDPTNGNPNHWASLNKIHVVGTLTFSGNYTSGGDTLNFGLPLIKSNSCPIYVVMTGVGIYLYRLVIGTTIANSKVKIFSLATGLEIGAGAYPGGVTADAVTFYAIFPKFI